MTAHVRNGEYMEVNGLTYFVQDQGAGEPVLLLHGFPDTGALWRHQVAALHQARFRTIVPDMRGRGLTEKPRDVAAYALPNLIQDIAGLLDALNLGSVHLIAHDWGAAAAWLFAAFHPDRVKSLAAISVGAPGAAAPDLEALQKGWYRLLFLFEGTAEELLKKQDWYLMRELLQDAPDLEQYLQELADETALRAGLNWYRANLPAESLLGSGSSLPKIQCPTLGIWSSGDLYLTEKSMAQSERFVAGTWRYERIEHAGHWIPLEQPERLNKLILEFLREF